MKLPVTILWGDKDTVTPLEQANDLNVLLPQAPPTILLRARSHSPDRGPPIFNDALLKALAKTLDSAQDSRGEPRDHGHHQIVRLWLCCATRIRGILTGYIPAFIDQNDMIFGLFRRTRYADGLHLVSALWALTAALTSRRASELFFQLFGVFYFADGVLGLLTGQRLSRFRHPHQRRAQPAAVQRASSPMRRISAWAASPS